MATSGPLANTNDLFTWDSSSVERVPVNALKESRRFSMSLEAITVDTLCLGNGLSVWKDES